MYCYEYLTKYIKSKGRIVPRIVYDAILKYLKMIPFIAQDFPEYAEKSALSLLHLTKQLITFYSCEMIEYVKPILHQVEIFRRWPFPVGVMAAELVQILFQECKCRGSAFRIKIREEIPDIDFLSGNAVSVSSYSNLNSQSQFGEEQQIQLSQPLQVSQNMPVNIQANSNSQQRDKQILTVFTFTDEKLSEMSNVLQYMQSKVRAKQQGAENYDKLYSPHALRLYLVGQILNLEQKLPVRAWG